MVNVRRAKAPQKVVRQIEKAALKDLRLIQVKAKVAVKNILTESNPHPNQMTIAGSAVKEGNVVSTG